MFSLCNGRIFGIGKFASNKVKQGVKIAIDIANGLMGEKRLIPDVPEQL